MENILVSDIDLEVEYLAHHGVKGMKWGVRRYQPYSLIPRGSGKGGKESGKAARRKSARERKVRRLKKAITNKLHPKKNVAVKELKSSSKSKKSRKEKQAEAKAEQIKAANTVRQRRESAAKVVNSGSAKEVLANKDMLTTKQLNDAIQRINTERQLKAIYAEQNPSTMKKISKYINKKNLDTAVGVVKSVGDMYKAVNDIKNAKNEAARAKAVKNAVRSGDAKTILDLQSKMTDSEVKDAMNRLRNLDSIRNTMKNETQSKPHATVGETIRNNKDKKAKDVVYDTDIPSFIPKKESTKAFDDYFENEVRKEKAKKRKKG